MTPAEKIKEIEKLHSHKYPDDQCGSRLIEDVEWLINRVKRLTEALEELAVYQFGINDKTGALVKQHCKEALKEKE